MNNKLTLEEFTKEYELSKLFDEIEVHFNIFCFESLNALNKLDDDDKRSLSRLVCGSLRNWFEDNTEEAGGK